jgi:hypothetical protein
MDVLDDVEAEAREVVRWNPWLTYTAELHRLREWGTANKMFDLIEEKALSSVEMVKYCELIFGAAAAADMPNPEVDINGFAAALERVVAAITPRRAAVAWNAIKKKNVQWVDVSILKRKFKRGGCLCFGSG